MNVFKYIWLKVRGYFNPPIEKDLVTFEDLYNMPQTIQPPVPWPKGGREEYEDWCNKRNNKQETYKECQDREDLEKAEHARKSGHVEDKNFIGALIKECREDRSEELMTTKFPPDLPPKEKDPARWDINEEKPKRPYNRATKQQVARIKVLVGRGKTTKQIAKDVGLPYDNVKYYVKKFGG